MANNFIIKEMNDEKDWQPTYFFPNTPFTQCFEYGKWQESLGYKVRRFVIEDNNLPISFLQIIFFPLLGKKKYGYIPYGPVASNFDQELLGFIKKALAIILKEENSSFIRMDFTYENKEADFKTLFKKSSLSSYTGAHFQPRYEWVLPLLKTGEQILSEMHQKTRYSVRLSEKKGVNIKIISEDFLKYFEDFWVLLETTAKRNGFNLHSKKYYQEIFSSPKASQNIYLAVAFFKNQILAIDLIFVSGNTAMYMFGGSSNEHRNLCAPYLAHFQAILEAKKRGAKFYNFGGVEDPERKLYKDWENLSSFKKKFGGVLLRHSDFYDLVTERLWYFLYNVRKFLKRII